MKWLAFILSAVSAIAQLPSGTRSPAFFGQYVPLTSNQIFALTPSMWYMADVGCYSNSGVNLCVNGMSIQRWTDCSPNGWNLGQLASEARKPIWSNGVINGHAAVIFDGLATKVLTNPAIVDMAMPNTVFLVAKTTNSAYGATQTIWSRGRNTATGVYGYIEASTGSFVFTQVTQAGTAWKPTKVTPFAWFVGCVLYDSKPARFFIDEDPTFATLPTTWVEAQEGLSLGASSVPDQPATIIIAEFLWFNARLNEHNRQGVQLYLMKKYNLPGNRWN